MITVRIYEALLGGHMLSLTEQRVAYFVFALAGLAAARLVIVTTSVVRGVVCEFQALLRVHNHVSNLVAEIRLG